MSGEDRRKPAGPESSGSFGRGSKGAGGRGGPGQRRGQQRSALAPGGARGRPQAPRRDVHDPDGVRLQKVMASAGVGSRRACEQLIEAGRVTVDGQVVTELGVRVGPDAVIEVNGERLILDDSTITLAFHKPTGVISTMSDPEGRPCIGDWVADRTERLYHVGRLDVDSEGLILLTNDGDLAHRLSHPSYEIRKTYRVTVEGQLGRGVAKAFLQGIELEDGIAQADSFAIVDSIPGATQVELVLHSGRNRVVRRMFDAVGYPVTRLVRTKVGPIPLAELKAGKYRVLSGPELGSLLQAVGR